MKKLSIYFILTLIIAAIIGIVLIIGKTKKTPKNHDLETTQSDSIKYLPNYQGKILAGNSSYYLEFSKTDYEKALSENKIIILDFYANWCPICRVEAPEIKAGFDSLSTDKVIGFRVNFNDSDTDEDEKNLAKDFNIAYQHTKVILKNGQEVRRSGDKWDEATFSKEIGAVLE